MTNSLLKVRLTSARTSEEMDGALKIDHVLVLFFDSWVLSLVVQFYQIDGLLVAKTAIAYIESILYKLHLEIYVKQPKSQQLSIFEKL